MKKLEEFLISSERNTWIKLPHINVYVRKGMRYIDGRRQDVLDVANISVSAKKRGKGIFTAFISKLEDMKPLNGIYIENILEERLIPFFENRNYTLHENSIPPCYYMVY